MNKTKEEKILSTPVFDVVRKEFDNTGFKPVGLNCQDWAMVVLTDGYNTVFIRQTRWGIEKQTIEFPCGTVEKGEDPKYAAVRELKEETGLKYKVEDLKEVITTNPNPAYFNNKMHIYSITDDKLVEKFSRKEKQMLDKNEDCEVFLAPYSEKEKELKEHALSALAYALLFN